MCFWCSKELSHREGSFEHPQNMFWLRNKKNNFQLHTLIWGPGVQGLSKDEGLNWIIETPIGSVSTLPAILILCVGL